MRCKRSITAAEAGFVKHCCGYLQKSAKSTKKHFNEKATRCINWISCRLPTLHCRTTEKGTPSGDFSSAMPFECIALPESRSEEGN
jgi:hypothetical protein